MAYLLKTRRSGMLMARFKGRSHAVRRRLPHPAGRGGGRVPATSNFSNRPTKRRHSSPPRRGIERPSAIHLRQQGRQPVCRLRTKLERPEPGVETSLGKQFHMSPTFGDAPALQHEDAVGALHGRQAMGDHE